MDSWPEAAGKWMKYYEKAVDKNGNKLLQRMENFTQYSAAMDYILNGAKLMDMSSQLFGEAAILYKEKINYKLPGGAGFDPHQDVAAGWWMYGQTMHISCLVGIDPATAANGALQVVYGAHDRGMLCEPWKELTPDFTASAEWSLVETEPGDIVFFDSYVPHRSDPNTTDKPRRVLYSTYAKASEGDWRLKYYADKRISFPPDCERLPDKKYEYKI
jgi:ectoine hydroxylase-related dioxygenase (phytanoyl-CoA dioxygenase family)